MVSLRNNKKRADSSKILHRLNEKSLKLKSKRKSDNLSKKKIKQEAKKNVESKKIRSTSKAGKVVPKKPINKKLSNEVQEKVNMIRRLSLRPSRKRNINEIERLRVIESENHMDSSKNLKSQVEENTKTKNNESNKTRKIMKTSKLTSSKCNKVMSNNKKSSLNTNTVSTNTKLQSLKKKKTENDNSTKNIDSLNLNNLSREHILQCINAIFHLTEEQLKNKNALFDGESNPIFMQITCIKVSKTPRRCIRMLLPHSIVSSNDEVALFVGDLQKGRRKDYDPTVEYYKDLLHKHNCTSIKSIIPMNQVKTEYDQYELKRKLVNSYDYFLVDGKIAGHLSHLLGKEFYKKRKLPTPIKMLSKDLKHEVEYALRKTVMQIHSFGDTHIVQIGHSLMKAEEIVENVLAACNYLSKNYPGGWNNIRSIRLKTANSLALPIYITLKNKSSIKVPVVRPKRPKAYRAVSGELSTVSGNTIVTVAPEGNITVKKKTRKMLNRLRNLRNK